MSLIFRPATPADKWDVHAWRNTEKVRSAMLTQHKITRDEHDAWWDREPDRWIDLPDCTLPYWTVGQGPDLVFVHGWPVDARTWRRVVPAPIRRTTYGLITAGRIPSRTSLNAKRAPRALAERSCELVVWLIRLAGNPLLIPLRKKSLALVRMLEQPA